MSNLTNNTAELREILAAVKALPEAGGSAVTPPAPDDGKTRIYIHLEQGRTSPMMGCCPKGTVTVDWGDGTEPDVLTGTSTASVKWTPTHNYDEPGDYVISLTVDGTMGFYGSSTQFSAILREAGSENPINRVYLNSVQKVEIGDGVTSIGNYAFYYCSAITSITISDSVTSIGRSAFDHCCALQNINIPDGVTSIEISAFSYCQSLKNITIPDSVTSIGNYAFQYCYSLQNITIPDGVTSIGTDAFQHCYAIASVTIPKSIASIESYAFYNCYGIRYYDFTACASVPALANTNAFTGIAADCEMLIPAALYDAWSTATNWATYASYMVAV